MSGTDVDAYAGMPLTVGMPVGRIYAGPDDGAGAVAIIVGSQPVALEDPAEGALWELTAALLREQIPLTAESLLASARSQGIAEPERVWHRLVQQGVATQVPTSVDDRVSFARAFRLRSLLVGIGYGEAGRHGRPTVGIPATDYRVELTQQQLDLWRWAPAFADLFTAARQQLAGSGNVGNDAHVAQLGIVLAVELIGKGAAFADLALPPDQPGAATP